MDYQSEFNIGQKVFLTRAPEIEATVTAIQIRKNGYIVYEVNWIHGGELKCCWFTSDDLISMQTHTELPSRIKGFNV
jgi:hypothetical protein